MGQRRLPPDDGHIPVGIDPILATQPPKGTRFNCGLA